MFSSFDQGLKLFIENDVVVFIRETVYAEVASTSKLIKLFHLTPNSNEDQTGSAAPDCPRTWCGN